jgi:hypothetical protein
LERLKNSKMPALGTVFTALVDKDSKDSSDVARFQKTHDSVNVDQNTTSHLPKWCQQDCPGLEIIPLPNEGDIAGCVHPITQTWRRLDKMRACAALSNDPMVMVPRWCRGESCEHFHKQVVPGLQTSASCCQEGDASHWRRDRIDAMNSCPVERLPKTEKST